jgi:hypothetical protein
MRKLTVKSFSVIKDAELEFGKITVLIGPQSSGKSLLCKLAYFMGRVALEIAIDQVAKLNDFSELGSAVQREFVRWFPESGWGEMDWSLEFEADQFSLSISLIPTSELSSEASVVFGGSFKSEYLKRLEETIEQQRQRGFLLSPALQSIAATKFMKLAGRAVWDAATYIPANRSFFVDTQKGYRALAEDPDPISARFAIVFANSMNREIPKSRISRFLNGELVYFQDGPAISFRDGRTLALGLLSSGSKEMLPMVSVLDMYEYRRRNSGPDLPSQELYGERLYVFDELTIEEPEASIFPQTQYSFVQEIVALSNETEFRPYFTISTHSPYILSSFKNLLEAWQVGHADEERAKTVRNVIDEKYWVNPIDFRAYSIESGHLKSIMDKETNLISDNYLDAVSERIGGEFDELMRIGYVEA